MFKNIFQCCYKFRLGFIDKREVNNEISDLSLTKQNSDNVLNESYNYGNFADPLEAIKYKIQLYLALNYNELEYIKEMNREDLYHIVWLYNMNNEKFF
jgi:hypothetical protein